MNRGIAGRLKDALAGTPLGAQLATNAAGFLDLRGDDAAAARIDGPVLVGLARVLASQTQTAGFLSHRPALLERIADADENTLIQRAAELEATPAPEDDDLENALDSLRLLRHEETCLTACLDLGGLVRFEAVSDFLSVLAEVITERALRLAQRLRGQTTAAPEFAVLGMGKIAGRELTYHSDLDLIFLTGGPTEQLSTTARVGQRLISYLSTMTGAGIAYAVDTRLRPSGGQGVLVSSLSGFERYQLETAETWEHMALLRSRAIAGSIDSAQAVLDRIRSQVRERGIDPWPYIAELRDRVERERASTAAGIIALKTGRGGLMDVDFLAKGGLLERPGAFPALPSVSRMLRTAGPSRRIEDLVADYRIVRKVESRARWIAGRAVEEAPAEGDDFERIAALVDPGADAPAVRARLDRALTRIREAFDAVVSAGTLSALAD